MQFSVISLFIVLSLSLLISCSPPLKLDKGNQDTVNAFNAALLELWQDGTYNDIHQEWFGTQPERFRDCVEDSAALSYPSSTAVNGLLDRMISSQSIKVGYFAPIAILPGFEVTNGVVTGGFYPDLLDAILNRIAINYNLAYITPQWVAITDVSLFYPDHVDGVYDVIFMNLFKTSMWSAPVAPRPEIWSFTCGLLTAEPLRYYVCPGAVTKGLNLTSAETLDTVNTVVRYIGGGAQETAALNTFPNSMTNSVPDITTLFDQCEDETADIIVELPNRITNTIDNIIVDSQPIGTYVNTGAAFRFDKHQ